MMNKYENRIRRTQTRTNTIQEKRREEILSTYTNSKKHIINGVECVALVDIINGMMHEYNCSLSTVNRSMMKTASWFDKIRVGRTVYYTLVGEPVEPDKEVTKSSAITTVATVLADIANIQDTLSAMTDFYETLDVEYEQVLQLNAMVRDAVFELANQADALAFTISEE